MGSPDAYTAGAVIVDQGQLRQDYVKGRMHNVRKLDGSIEQRDNDLEELVRDWMYYRSQILEHVRSGDGGRAAEAREDFQRVNVWLDAYGPEDVSSMNGIIERERRRWVCI